MTRAIVSMAFAGCLMAGVLSGCDRAPISSPLPAAKPFRTDVHAEQNAAYSAATNLIKARLIAPSTALFSPQNQSVVVGDATNYMVDGYVDAQNPFGAQIRREFNCDLDFNTETQTWSCRELRFGLEQITSEGKPVPPILPGPDYLLIYRK